MGKCGVGMPLSLYLNEYGSQLWSAFDTPPYLVGSVLKTKDYHDVDVRIILSDKDYKKQGFGKPNEAHQNLKWISYCMAFSELGKKITGLPIDFQIQQRTDANKNFKEPRSALGIIPLRMKNT